MGSVQGYSDEGRGRLLRPCVGRTKPVAAGSESVTSRRFGSHRAKGDNEIERPTHGR